MPRSNVIKEDLWRFRKEERNVAAKAAKEHKNNKNGCPFRIGITISSDGCNLNRRSKKSLCNGCTLPSEHLGGDNKILNNTML